MQVVLDLGIGVAEIYSFRTTNLGIIQILPLREKSETAFAFSVMMGLKTLTVSSGGNSMPLLFRERYIEPYKLNSFL